ncbi:hypothetical protein AAVH_18913 [Aphelenchoides avenae]|nr:hypothetical protein AAVH_18913 [Aphelenchus avenae]
MHEYATTHGFDGCDDNKCPQIFIARYTNRSQGALKKLQASMDKYIFLSVFLQSFCSSYTYDDEDEIHSRARNETVQDVRSLLDGMDLTKNLSSHEGTAKPCGRNETVSVPIEKVNSYAKEAIDAKTENLKPRSWEDRQSLHEAIAKGIIERLKNLTISGGYSYEALSYLPYAGRWLRCGYEFVWYELGYRYFPDGYVTGNHTLSTQDGNKYSDKGGQIICFP